MTSLEVIETGEVVEQMTKVEAERITARIADKLDGIADNIEQVMPLIREALTRKAWKPLGYTGASAYVSERFAGAFQRLPAAVRRPIVAELSSAGMSTRAIAPIVGVSKSQVAEDKRGVQFWTPAPEPHVNRETGEILETTVDYQAEPQKITGMDGKQYPKPAPAAPRRPSLTQDFQTAVERAWAESERLIDLVADDRFNANQQQIAADSINRARAIARNITRFIDALNPAQTIQEEEARERLLTDLNHISDTYQRLAKSL